MREELATVSAQRPLRDAYKAVPLTGVQQSMVPSYRLATRFMKFTALDENGLVPEDDGAQDARDGAKADFFRAFHRVGRRHSAFHLRRQR